MIKRATRKRILLLKSEGGGKVECIKNVYPAQALGDIAYDDEINPDFLFFVEDYKAKYLLEQMIDRYKSIAYKELISPFYKVIPVGGFNETIEFLSNSDQIFRDEVKRFAFLDKDVETESLEEAKQNEKYKFLQKVKDNKNKIKYLPCTPEVGIVELIHGDLLTNSESIKKIFNGHNIDLTRIVDEEDYRAINSQKPRKKAKHQLDYIISSIARRTGTPTEQCEKLFAYHYVNCEYEKDDKLHELLAPIFKPQ